MYAKMNGFAIIIFLCTLVPTADSCTRVTVSPSTSSSSSTTTSLACLAACPTLATVSPPFNGNSMEVISAVSVTAACTASNTAAVGDTITYDCVSGTGTAMAFMATFSNTAAAVDVADAAVLQLTCTTAGWESTGNTVTNNVLTSTTCV